MEMILGQLRYFGASFLCGIVLMFAYDFVEVFRCQVKHKKVAIFLEDWSFWAVAAVLIFQMIFALNHGIIRSFFIISFIGGMFGYRMVAKRYVIKGMCAVLAFLFRPCVWIRRKIAKNSKKNLK